MSKGLNCPNCGAVITGSKCEYCGTRFYDFCDNETNIDLTHGTHYLRLKIGNETMLVKAYCSTVQIDYNKVFTGNVGRNMKGDFPSVKKKISLEFVEV